MNKEQMRRDTERLIRERTDRRVKDRATERKVMIGMYIAFVFVGVVIIGLLTLI